MKKLYASLITISLLSGSGSLLAMFGKEAGKKQLPSGTKPVTAQPAKPATNTPASQPPAVAAPALDPATQQALQQAVDAMKAVKAAAPNDQVRKLVMDALRNAAA